MISKERESFPTLSWLLSVDLYNYFFNCVPPHFRASGSAHMLSTHRIWDTITRASQECALCTEGLLHALRDWQGVACHSSTHESPRPPAAEWWGGWGDRVEARGGGGQRGWRPDRDGGGGGGGGVRKWRG